MYFKNRARSLNPIVGVLALTGVVAHANAQDGDFLSMQMKGVAQVTVDVDARAAAERLSKGVQFPTISNQDRRDFDTEAFAGYHEFLVEAYPYVHKTMERELLGDLRPYSLLSTWEGKNPSLPPSVFMAHQDVVPIAEESRDQWLQEPFSGAIADGYIWGRGVLDDKNQIHALLEAAEMKIEEGFQPTRTIMFVFGHDEEVCGPEGARHIVDVLEERGLERIAPRSCESLQDLAPSSPPSDPPGHQPERASGSRRTSSRRAIAS